MFSSGASDDAERRTAALARYRVLDAPPAEAFGRITRLAARLVGVPVAFLGFTGGDELFIRHVAGDALPTPLPPVSRLADSFCQHVVKGAAPFVVEDARTHPLVRHSPHLAEGGLVAYLGVPIHGLEGEVLGSLCATDVAPRAWRDDDVEALRELASLLHDELALRATTQALRAQQALTLDERRFTESALDALQDIFFVLGPHGHLVRWNRRVAEVTGYADDELARMHATDLFDPPDAPRVRAAIHLVAERGAAAVDVELRTKHGESVPFAFHGSRLLSVDGGLAGICGTGRDLRAHRTAARALKEKDDRLQLALRAGRMGTWEWDLIEETITWSSHACALIGYPPEKQGRAVSADDFFARLGEGDDACLIEAGRRTLEDDAEFDVPCRYRHPDGAMHWLHARGRLERDAEGRPVRLIGTITDVTRQREAEAEIRRSRLRFEELVNSVDGILWEGTVDARTRDVTYTFVSDRLRTVLGYEPADWVADAGRWADAIVEEERNDVLATCLATTLRRQDHTLEYRMRGADGRVVWLRDLVSIMGERDGVLTVAGLMVDVTDRKAYEEALIAAKEEAEEAARLKETFLANMSHELRTPLTSIIGLADVLADEVPETQLELVDMIRRSGRRLHETLDSVLDLAQIRSGALHLRPRPLDLAEEARAVAARFEDRAEEKGLRLAVEAPDAPVRAHMDRSGLRRMVGHLVSNAIKFTDAGGVTLRVDGAAPRPCIEIVDTGVGIAPHFLPQLFEEFQQESMGLARSFEGSGLGLAIVKHLADRMDCRVTVASEPGEGTTFRVFLPVPLDDEGDAPSEAPARGESSAEA